MAGRKRITRLTHRELISEIRADIDFAAGWVSNAEEDREQGQLIQAAAALDDALDGVAEAKRRWRAARARITAIERLLNRLDQVPASALRQTVSRRSAALRKRISELLA